VKPTLFRVVDRRKNITPEHRHAQVLFSIEQQPFEIQFRNSMTEKWCTIPGSYFTEFRFAQKELWRLRQEEARRCSPSKT
jgi:hypothetical protein